MTATFAMGEVIVQLDHEGDCVAQEIEALHSLWRVPDVSKPSLRFRVRKGAIEAKIPEGAIRTRFHPESEESQFHLKNTKIDVLGAHAFAVNDFGNRNVEITYVEPTWRVKHLVLSSFRWSIVKTLEQHGYGYIHASAASWQDKVIAFNGNPGAGKSSSLFRLVRDGGKVITDDTLLFQRREILPFDADCSIRGDFEVRFGERSSINDTIQRNFVPIKRFEGIDLLIFPLVRFSPASELRPLSLEEGLARLWKSYLVETNWNTYPEEREVVLERYRSLLSKARCFEFLAGVEEAEVTATLLASLTDEIARA